MGLDGMMGTQEDQGSFKAQLDSANEALHAVLDIGMSGRDALDAEEQLYDILQTLIDHFKADAAVLHLREGNNLTAFMALGAGEDAVQRFTVARGQGFEGTIAETKQHLFIQDARVDPLVLSPYVKKAGIRSLLGVPLLYGGEVIGVLHVDWRNSHYFSELELEILQVAAERCSSAIAVGRLCELNLDLGRQAAMYLDIIEHDMKNLNKIMLDDLDVLLSVPALGTEARMTIDALKRDVQETETVIDNVRVLHETLNDEIPVDTLDIDGLIEDALKEVEWPPTKNVEIHYTPQMGRMIMGSPLLKDVLFTLFNNAIMCSRGDVKIDVTVDKVHVDLQPYYAVSIIDNAQMIPEATREELFTFHLGITQAHGKGLPLFLVKLILERLDGDIRMESRVPGDYKQGSEFVITLPAIEAKVVPEPEPVYP